MKAFYSVILPVLLLIPFTSLAQNYPTFGPEKHVTITGLTFDAMEPNLSPDGNTLFFNSLNSGGNTNLYYATKINDSTFQYEGLLNGCYDSSPDHLDGVASIDTDNNFYWVSMRGYPVTIENLHRGLYSSGSVTDTTRVYGDFNIPILGWIIMDAFISQQGDQLIYCNAYFDFINNSCGVGIPCEARLGVALKINDTTFNKLPNTDALFDSINNNNYLVYAPQLTQDGLELYFTRLQKSTYNTEICVAVRSNTSEPFSEPVLLYSNYGFVPEAPTLTSDKQIMYYHQKNLSGIFEIYMRIRDGSTAVKPLENKSDFQLYYNAATQTIQVKPTIPEGKFSIQISNQAGQTIMKQSESQTVEVESLTRGMYIATLRYNHKKYSLRFIRE